MLLEIENALGIETRVDREELEIMLEPLDPTKLMEEVQEELDAAEHSGPATDRR